MEYIKFQVGCLVIVLYIVFGYLWETIVKNGRKVVKCDSLFDILLFLAPWSIIFDGLTSYTVNHQDIVPVWVNNIFHLIYYLLMNGVIIITFVYFYKMTVGFPTKKSKLALQFIPALISIIIVIAFSGQIEYIEGKNTFYSMGVSAVACYISIVYHYGYILLMLIIYHKTIARRKRVGVGVFILLCGITLILQIVFPELLLTALYPALMIIGIYINFENPSIIRLNQNNSDMVSGFANVVETRDGNTGGHIKRTREYVGILLHEMAKKSEYKSLITQDYKDNVKNAAPLHDIGKIATPDKILTKPGKLTSEEFEIMKEHASKGSEIVSKSFSVMENYEFEKIAYEVARYHHEKWNGSGYPEGLVGEEIPLHARIMAIADVFDAVSEKRCYRDALPLEKCFEIIEKGAGTDFDPALVKIFLNARHKVETKYKAINNELEKNILSKKR